MREWIMWICESHQGGIYDLPQKQSQLAMIANIEEKIWDIKSMIKTSEQGLKDYTIQVSEMGGNILKAGMSRIALFWKVVEYELEVYNKLNYLTAGG